MLIAFFVSAITLFASLLMESIGILATAAICHKILRGIGIPAFFLQV
jgi:hypothetical protein